MSDHHLALAPEEFTRELLCSVSTLLCASIEKNAELEGDVEERNEILSMVVNIVRESERGRDERECLNPVRVEAGLSLAQVDWSQVEWETAMPIEIAQITIDPNTSEQD